LNVALAAHVVTSAEQTTVANALAQLTPFQRRVLLAISTMLLVVLRSYLFTRGATRMTISRNLSRGRS
jgi:hypothetical protein